MKKLSITVLSVVLGMLLSSTLLAQNDLNVPLSNPDRPGKLIVNAVFADDVIIRAYNGREVSIILDGEDEADDDYYNRNGLRRISTSGAGLEITEDNNEVTVKTSPNSDDIELEILVPENFSVQMKVTHGDVYVKGVRGEHEIVATNGDIEMEDIRGSVIVNSVNGDIEVELLEVFDDTPMSFTGLNGDIEVGLPGNAKFTGKMKTDYGDVYTNFDMRIDRSASASEITRGEGRYTVTVNKWITGTVNGGGPEYLFKTLHGDIEIRKNS
ncbi:MAG: DUF4097 domain-containing protein [Balneolales bacterium]|nr:DUF4097 domain-containing protein [Balneolales bacterium]